MNCPIRNPEGRGQIIVCDMLDFTLAAVNIGSSLGFLGDNLALVVCGFVSFHFLDIVTEVIPKALS
jgi:hypothetical protein